MKKKLRMLLGLILSVSLFSSTSFAASDGLQNFQVTNMYHDGQFTDVADDAWYKSSVAHAYELDLMAGNSASTFNPTGNITQAEALTITARIHKIYTTGNDDFSEIQQEMQELEPTILDWCYGSKNNPAYKEFYNAWYSPYIYYLYTRVWPEGRAEYPQFPALAYDPIHAPFIDAQTPITRQRFVAYLFAAVPEHELKQINVVDDGGIPDVTYADSPEVYLLYRAGVMSGGDSLGTFFPNSYITRAEVSSIVTRIVNPSLRKEITLLAAKDVPNTPAIFTPTNSNGSIGTNVSEYVLDVRDSVTFMVSYTGYGTISVNYDSDIVRTTWGEWEGDYIPLTIKALQYGYSELEIFDGDDPSSCIYVDVWVEENNTNDNNSPENPEEIAPDSMICIGSNTHNWVSATCTEPKRCAVCGITDGVALGHTIVIDEAVEATSIRTGLTEGKHCSICGEVLVEQKVVPKDTSLIESTSFRLTNNLSEEYSYVASKLYTRCKIDSVDYTVSPFNNEKISLKITLLLRKTVQGETTNDNIKLNYTLYRDGVAVQSSIITILNTELDTLYERTIYYTGEPGDFTLTCKSARY